ncbi:hypothetical protein HOY82DRAFT_590561 [Tuber indicum]|nr:hypothetical protein HOY82DRAFT_590561 [Tuber indicum]
MEAPPSFHTPEKEQESPPPPYQQHPSPLKRHIFRAASKLRPLQMHNPQYLPTHEQLEMHISPARNLISELLRKVWVWNPPTEKGDAYPYVMNICLCIDEVEDATSKITKHEIDPVQVSMGANAVGKRGRGERGQGAKEKLKRTFSLKVSKKTKRSVSRVLDVAKDRIVYGQPSLNGQRLSQLVYLEGLLKSTLQIQIFSDYSYLKDDYAGSDAIEQKEPFMYRVEPDSLYKGQKKRFLKGVYVAATIADISPSRFATTFSDDNGYWGSLGEEYKKPFHAEDQSGSTRIPDIAKSYFSSYLYSPPYVSQRNPYFLPNKQRCLFLPFSTPDPDRCSPRWHCRLHSYNTSNIQKPSLASPSGRPPRVTILHPPISGLRLTHTPSSNNDPASTGLGEQLEGTPAIFTIPSEVPELLADSCPNKVLASAAKRTPAAR